MKKTHLFVLAAMLLSGIVFSVVQIILADPSPVQTHPVSEIECDANLCVDTITGKVGIGIIAPTAKLHISAPASTEGLRIVTASNYSPLNIRNSDNSADIFRVDQAGSLAVGSVPWARLSIFPPACTSGQYVTAVGSTLTCDTPSFTDADSVIGNEVTNATNATLVRSGSGTAGSPYTLALNLNNVNTWTAAQSFSATPLTLSANTAVLSFSSATGNKTISTGGTTHLNLAPGGNVLIGGGTGKLTVGTVDPVYNIQGDKYATYMSGMLGVKEETTGNVYLNNGEYVIDFNILEPGSDLWIFYRITDFGQNWSKLTVLLSAEGPGASWYQKDPQNNRLTIYSQTASSVSYRLTAPRFDWQKWLNVAEDGTAGMLVEEITNNRYVHNTEESAINSKQSEQGFAQNIKETIASFGLILENNIARVRQVIAERIAADTVELKQFQMIDKATGQIYCVWIEQGEWVKIKGNCQ